MNKEVYNDKEDKILEEGTHKGYKYMIMRLKTHPVCYIKLPDDSELREFSYDDIHLDVHGGLTYKSEDEEGHTWIGWDYAHSGDYMNYSFKNNYIRENEKKWTFEELKAHVKDAISQIPYLKKYSKEEYYFA